MEIKTLPSFFIPASSKSFTDNSKLLILMHGLGDSLESYKILPKEINVTGLNYLLLNAPKRYYFGFSWYDIPPGDPKKGIEKSSNLVLDVIEELCWQGFQSEDIFVGGFSQGGCIALETFMKSKRKLNGAVCLSPRIYLNEDWFEKVWQKESPIFMAHGLQDEAIPFEQTESSYLSLRNAGFNIEWNEYEMDHRIEIEEIMALREWLNEYL